MSRRIDGVLGLKPPITIPFQWRAAGATLAMWTNMGTTPVYLHGATVRNDAVAGTGAAAVVKLKTPNTEYRTITLPGSSATTANGVANVDIVGTERIDPGQSLLLSVTTATTAALSGSITLLMEGN